MAMFLATAASSLHVHASAPARACAPQMQAQTGVDDTTAQAGVVTPTGRKVEDSDYARVWQLNRNANTELELYRVQEEFRTLKERVSPTRRATFIAPFLVVSAYSGYVAVTAPDFDFPGLDSIKEAVRKLRIDGPAERANNLYFPGSLGSSVVDHLVAATLEKRGYTAGNTLFATSTCPDEVNTRVGELTDLLKIRWGENFGLGGLGGVPFTGKAGFSAYAHHVPDQGKMFILFAPHVGVEFDGKVGALRRVNQADVSTACGAAIGAYNGIIKDFEKEKKEKAFDVGDDAAYGVVAGLDDAFDAQIQFIKSRLRARLKGIEDSPDRITYVTYAMYSLVREFFIDELLLAPGVWDFAGEVTVLGGIMINRGKGGDRFQPLLFQTRTQEAGSTVDLYEQTFGQLPDLTPALGEGQALVDEFFDYDLETTGERWEEKLKEMQVKERLMKERMTRKEA